MAVLTLAGMTKLEPEIWDGFKLPEEMDAQLEINIILNLCGGNEVRYPEPDYLGFYIGMWCTEHMGIFSKLYNTTVLEYNPIHNYDMSGSIKDELEDVKDIITKSGKRILDTGNTRTLTREIGETETPSGSKTNTKTSSNVSGSSMSTVEHQVSAYNTSAYQPHSKDITTISQYPTMQDKDVETYQDYKVTRSPTSGTDETTDSGNETETWEDYSDVHSKEGTTTRTEKKSGNIGVTTTQKMITEEREVAMFNLYRQIAHMFEDDFTICVY